MYKVSEILILTDKTIVTIEGNGNGLKSRIYVKNEDGDIFFVNHCSSDNEDVTRLMIDGVFSGKTISFL